MSKDAAMRRTQAAASQEAVKLAKVMLAGAGAPVFANERERNKAVVRLAADILVQSRK